MAPSEYRLRIAYQKAGRLRFLSHLEVVRALERTARRAVLPYALTKGFSPHMKLAFGPALPVGTAGRREYVDLWLTEYIPAGEALKRLSANSATELSAIAAGYVGDREPSLTAECTIGEYEVVVSGDGAGPEALGASLRELLAEGRLVVERKGKTKVFDLDESLPKEPRVEGIDHQPTIVLTVRMGPQGSLRPEDLVGEAIARSGAQASVALVTRTDTLIEEEEGVWRRPL